MAAINITDQNFESEVIQNKTPVLVDFWANWCGPCKLAAPALDELSEEYEGKVHIMKLDVDQNPTNTSKFGVLSIPTTILFKDGKELGRQVGFAGKNAFEELLKKAL